MKDLQENIVPAKNQVSKSIYFTPGKGRLRVLFAGNSITLHGVRPEIGWYGEWGMAASAKEKDYVHLLTEKMKKYDPGLSFCIAQVSEYEREFYTADPAVRYAPAADFNADLIIMFFGANVSKEYDKAENPPKSFGQAYEDLRSALTKNNKNAAVFHSQGFYIRPRLEEEKRAVAQKYGDVYMELGDIQTREETHGLHNHPSDQGMAEIAEVFWKHIEPTVKKLCEGK